MRPSQQRYMIADFSAFDASVQTAISDALNLRKLLSAHHDLSPSAINAFGHDINNSVTALNGAVQLARAGAAPANLVDMLLSDYSPRVAEAFDELRSHLHGSVLNDNVDALQEKIDGIFGQLRLAKERHLYPQADQLRQVKILGTVGLQGQQGVWL